MGNTEIEAIERNIKQAKEIAEFGAAVERLRSNKDFKKVVEQGYFEREPIRLVHLKADPAVQGPDAQRSIVAQMDAIGAFSAFLTQSLQRSEIARKQVAEGEAMVEELAAAGGDE